MFTSEIALTKTAVGSGHVENNLDNFAIELAMVGKLSNNACVLIVTRTSPRYWELKKFCT
jgi:hypothetical protein